MFMKHQCIHNQIIYRMGKDDYNLDQWNLETIKSRFACFGDNFDCGLLSDAEEDNLKMNSCEKYKKTIHFIVLVAKLQQDAIPKMMYYSSQFDTTLFNVDIPGKYKQRKSIGLIR